MEPVSTPNAPRHHHYIPRHYLKGFAERGGSSFVWVYERGRNYHPGDRKQDIYNPCRQTTKNVGVERDFYACKLPDGTIDFDSYERQLAAIESAGSLLLAKLRKGESLTQEEKSSFSKYILLMHKRVPARQERVSLLWPEWLDKEGANSPFLRGLDDLKATTLSTDVATLERIEEARALYHRVTGEYREEIPDHIRLSSMTGDIGMVSYLLSEMNWTILLAPTGYIFIAGDNPVFFTNGLKYENALVLFPISSSAALVISWVGNSPLQYVQAPSEQVTRMNTAIMSASNKVYCARSDRYLAEEFNQLHLAEVE